MDLKVDSSDFIRLEFYLSFDSLLNILLYFDYTSAGETVGRFSNHSHVINNDNNDLYLESSVTKLETPVP